MNECTTVHIELNDAYTRATRAFSDLAEAFYDLAQSASFHGGSCNEPVGGHPEVEASEPAAAVQPCGEEARQQAPEELNVEPDRSEEGNEKAHRVVSAKPEHLMTSQNYLAWNRTRPLPTAADARACFEANVQPNRSTTMREFANMFRAYCRAHDLAQIDHVGMRYLLYSSGYEVQHINKTRYIKRKSAT